MKPYKFANLIVFGLVLTVAAAGCRKRPGYLTPLPAGMTHNPGDAPPGNPIEDANKIKEGDLLNGIKSNEPGSHQGWVEDPNMFKSEIVHFEYDSSVVKSSEKSKVAAVASHLKANSSSALRIEGHCDERGTDEYNRALGERRALALREELARMGIDPSRVDTISYGRDRPIDTGHAESSHRKNRRGEFVLLTPPK
jgi:peptidoglycan-associated lipoprotein